METRQPGQCQPGDRVRVNDTAFKGLTGTIYRVDDEGRSVIVMVQIPTMRGPTPVELRIEQIDPE